MAVYRISKSFEQGGEVSERAAAVMRMFGVTADRLGENGFGVNCQVEINDGDVVYITGPSGAGKSVLLRELERAIPASERVNLARVKPAKDKSLIDCVADGDVLGALRLLSVAGLSDVFCIVNEVRNLSDGQKWRLRLTMALAAEKKFIFADEFCCELDRISSAVISYNIQRHAKREGVTFILAGASEDILGDLQPDVLVVKELSGGTEVIYKDTRDKTTKKERFNDAGL
jgi:ABC-type ATPase with predicted acetyltransferase domain